MDIEIEDRASWPLEFLNEVIQNRRLIIEFQKERRSIDLKYREDIGARIDPPQNRHEIAFRKLVERLEPLLTPNRLVAYHCTRLTPTEVIAIKKNGLKLLSHALVGERLNQCHADGHINDQVLNYLKSRPNVQCGLADRNGKRMGMIWFCPNRSTLQDCSAVYRLFRSWGGEVVYNGHEKDSKVATVLSTVGTPCIVKCAIPFSDAKQFSQGFAPRFLSQFVSDEIEYPEPPPSFDLYVELNVSPSNVLDIIKLGDQRFSTLTNCIGSDEHD